MIDIAKILIVTGIFLVLFGLVWAIGGKFFPIGKLPGDISIKKGNFSFYFPLASSIVISILLSVGFLIYRSIRGY